MKAAVMTLAFLAGQVLGQWPRAGDVRVALPLDLVEVLDGAKFKIRVPANWNGTLLVYLQGTKVTPSPEPLVVPPVVPGSSPGLEETMLARGYALAASDFGSVDMQTKEAAQDSLELTAYFKGRVGEPKRALLWGTSNGALVSLRMIEAYPQTYDGAVATCPPAAGFARGMDRHLDFSVAYAAGPYTQNLDHLSMLLPEEKSYLNGIGVDPEALLARMNAMRNISSAAHAHDYAERYGSLRGLLRRPVITLHNTTDNVADPRQESAYRAQVAWWGTSEKLVQTYVKNPGHCAFTSAQLLAALEVMQRWLDTGTRPDASAFPGTLNFDNTYVPAQWPY